MWRTNSLCTLANEDLGTLAEYDPLTQSDPSFEPASLVMTTPIPSTEVPEQKIFIAKVPRTSGKVAQHDRMIKICTDAEFLTTVEVGQYFMTEDTEEFSQFTESVACREYTLPRDEKSSDPKGWIRGKTKIGTVLEVTSSYLQGKYGVEIRIESVNKDNSHSSVRISHGLKKLVTDLIDKEYDDNEQKASETKLEDFERRMYLLLQADQRPKQNHEDVLLLADPQELYLLEKEVGLILNHKIFSLSDYSVSKKLINLLCHGRLPREDDGATKFWRIKDCLQNHFVYHQHWSDEKWKSSMAGGGGNKKRFQFCTDLSGQEILYLRALQGHSGRNPIDPSLQDNVSLFRTISSSTFITSDVRSIYTPSRISGLVPGGQNLGRGKQAVFFTAVNPMDKEHKDPYKLDLTHPRLAWYKHKTWKRHQDTVYWVDIQLAQRKRIEVLSNTIERNHPLRHVPSLLYPESCCDGIWRNQKRESICVTSATSKDFLLR